MIWISIASPAKTAKAHVSFNGHASCGAGRIIRSEVLGDQHTLCKKCYKHFYSKLVIELSRTDISLARKFIETLIALTTPKEILEERAQMMRHIAARFEWQREEERRINAERNAALDKELEDVNWQLDLW